MINLTFASCKNRDAQPMRALIPKKQEIPSFKACHPPSKRLDNQENTLPNPLPPKKNLVKVDKSSKKHHNTTFKSPIRPWDTLIPRPTHKNRLEEKAVIMTPSLSKNNRSTTAEEGFNSSFLTQKQSMHSEQGSISSCKNSFNDSFHLYQEEDLSRDNVNSSLELSSRVAEFPSDLDTKAMKKSHLCFNSSSSVLNDLQAQCSASVTSVPSIKFSEKFKHYKKRHPSLVATKQALCLADFRLLEELGSGKYGKVYLAKHIDSGFVCALKCVSKKVIREEKLEGAFIREIKIQMFLNHPNVVQLYGLFQDSDQVCLVMEYCSGHNLFRLIKERRHLPQSELLLVLTHLFEAVSYLHCNGVIHRDIKPENVVIQHGTYKLCDFGWATYACGDTRTTFCGTPLYVCPEVLKGEEYNEKADIWGLGIVTYELAYGRVPFAVLSQQDLLKIVKDPVSFPMWNQISQKWVPLVRRMLSKQSQERPSLNEILTSELFQGFRESPQQALKEHLFNILI